MTAQRTIPPRRRVVSLLRKVSTTSILPAIPLLILHSALTNRLHLTLVVIPLLTSTILGLTILRKARKLALQLATNDSSPSPPEIKKAKKKVLLLFIFDLALATVYAILLVSIHVKAIKSSRTSMLTAYVCMPLWVNLFAHSLLATRILCKALVGCVKRKHMRTLQSRGWKGSRCMKPGVNPCSERETAETATMWNGNEKDVLLTPTTTVDDARGEVGPVAA
ncbi:hypothetical protein BDZ85DRAFT_98504 [Elsinoe ampelina]|uniref:Uncharacterized protein n=1 Tax=Elsinoe ampelina TaxID=302913 RepID=A0A6A6GEN2_9PEZI|nr:hypothetical protein BDZ85DRAFT_98504 [Elsinoe ampelina]